jgi:hypothetical protein
VCSGCLVTALVVHDAPRHTHPKTALRGDLSASDCARIAGRSRRPSYLSETAKSGVSLSLVLSWLDSAVIFRAREN